ncbi:hypothetical protein Tco_0556986 [Tanacetum coccineum]
MHELVNAIGTEGYGCLRVKALIKPLVLIGRSKRNNDGNNGAVYEQNPRELRVGITRPTINQDTPFELKGKFLKELRDNTFSGSEHEYANKYIEKVLEIVDLFHIPKVTQDQIMLQAFPISLTRAASRWLRNQPSGSITTWEVLKTKFLNKYCPPARTAKKMEEINNFQQICRTIQDKAEYSQKWHNGTSSRTRSTETFDGLAAIQEPSEEVDNVGGIFINLEISKCWSLEISRRLFNTLFAQILKMENHPEQNIKGVSSF